MQQLSSQSYLSIMPLVKASGMRGHLALVYEVLEGRMDGRVLVDSSENPRTALVCSSNGFGFAFGAPDPEVVRGPLEALFMENRREVYANMFASNAAWVPVLRDILAPLGAEHLSRLGFELRGFPPMPEIPTGFQLAPIDARLAQSILDGTGTDNFGLDPWFIKIAGGPAAYEKLNLGLALVSDSTIAAMAGICGLSHEEAELEVGTTPAYRGRGLATVVSVAFMHQCRERGLLPAYSCDAENAASIGVARKLGYVPVEEIHGYNLFL